jgi:hypothetical protein
MAMKKLALAVAALALSGCAVGTFTTRAACTVAGDKVVLLSQWGELPSVGTELDSRDAKAILEACKK